MTTDAFKEYVKTCRALDTEEIHRFMDDMSNEARRITPAEYSIPHTGRSTRITFELFGYEVPESLGYFHRSMPISVKISPSAKGVHQCLLSFSDHGGVIIGDGCQIGHNVVFATLNHGLPRKNVIRPILHPLCRTYG